MKVSSRETPGMNLHFQVGSHLDLLRTIDFGDNINYAPGKFTNDGAKRSSTKCRYRTKTMPVAIKRGTMRAGKSQMAHAIDGATIIQRVGGQLTQDNNSASISSNHADE